MLYVRAHYWGISSNAKNQDTLPYTLSILPTLYILGIHLYFDEYFLPLIGFGFILLIPIDIYFSKSKMAPKWWLLLRIPLSVTVFGILNYLQHLKINININGVRFWTQKLSNIMINLLNLTLIKYAIHIQTVTFYHL